MTSYDIGTYGPFREGDTLVIPIINAPECREFNFTHIPVEDVWVGCNDRRCPDADLDSHGHQSTLANRELDARGSE